MVDERGGAVYSLDLLRETRWWAIPVALAFALVGTAATHDLRFGASCLLGATADIGTLAFALRGANGADPKVALSRGSLGYVMFGRLALKAVLLVAAAAFPAWLNLWGMAAGVLTVDVTLATAGSIAAARNAFRPHETGR
jgi:hypothetical protein